MAGPLDICKCFDQIIPLLIDLVLHIRGLPWRVLGLYVRMMRGVQVVNMLPQGAGKPYRRRRSIPQGCPFSMIHIAVLLRPWISSNRGSAMIPPTLCYDLLLAS